VHVPDGFFDATTSVATGVAAAVAVGLSLRGARRELDDKTAPLTGLIAAFIFAVQMLNFPVGAGTSGHLLGGALAAVLVGPWTAVLCMTVVLAVQTLMIADGGITALGTNVLLMGVVTVVVGWAVFSLCLRLMPRRPTFAVPASFVAALVSVPASALAFVGLYTIGGTAEISLQAVAAAMVGWHVLIGIGEAVITAATVGAVIAVRPDLVYGARGLLSSGDLEIRSHEPVAPLAEQAKEPTS
jgi:cobalt/nickel transport system permease protein